jgi:myo-inositol-1(or 4)-monophosphatase
MKGAADFVSRVDEEAQEAALEVIGSRHPDHLVLAEEDDAPVALPGDDTPLWVVDPLDGTTNFLHRHPAHAASVAVTVSGHPVAAAVTSGPTGERWWARRGGGTFKSGVPVTTSSLRELARALVGTGFPFRDPSRLDEYMVQFRRVVGATAGARRGGSAALDLCYLAEGRFDAFWELSLSPWDYAAGWLIVQEAGGGVDRVEGGGMGLVPGSVLAAASPHFLEEVRRLLNGGDLGTGLATP